MLKVASMKRAKRILVVGGVLLVCAGTADAGIWGRNAQKPAETAPAASAITLGAVEVEGTRVVLRTSGAPAFTSYSPSPGVFVVDLTGTARGADLVIPATLPAVVVSIAADDVVEMGSGLTRVTFRLAETVLPEVSAIQNGVVVALPASAVADADPAEGLPAVTPLASDPVPAAAESVIEVPVIAESELAAQPEPTPAAVIETLAPAPVAAVSLPRARSLRSIDTSTSNGNVEVSIRGDGEFRYKAFRLDNPSRLVIDLDGVRNGAKRSTVDVDDDVVQRVRVAQFQPTIARVVVDLTGKPQYDIVAVGDELRVAFGTGAVANTTPAPQRKAEPAVIVAAKSPAKAPEPARATITEVPVPADLPARVPVVAENAPSWNVPAPASSGARSVIRPAVDQAPPPQQPEENVFDQATTLSTPAPQNLTGAQNLTGTRTLGGGERVFTGEPISLNLKDADIKDVLATFAELTGLNIAVDPGVSGSVTVDFVDVPWDQALDLILRQNGLTFTIEGSVMRVGTIQRITAEREASARLEEQERLQVDLTTLAFKLSYARAQEVSALLKDIASPRARIIVDTRTNQVIISEIPEVLQTMQNLIATIDIPSRQVMIEARIVESLRTFSQQWGFEWGFSGDLDPATGSGTGLVFPNRIGYDAGPFEFAAGNPVISLSLFDVLGTFNLDLALHAAETQGYAKVVSAPRVTTQDNTPAEIQSGFQIPYQTRVNFTTTVTYLDATLRLSVTPQITEAGTVIMDIAVQKNEPATGLTIAGAAGTPLTTRQARTRLMVRDGGTAVIAGIFQTRDGDARSRVPFIHNIPVIGALFRTHDVTTSHDELLIFITPRIVRG